MVPLKLWADLLERTCDVVRPSIAKLAGASLDRPTPCAEWSLRQLLNHTTAAIEMFAAAAQGGVPAPASPDREVDASPIERFDAAVNLNLAVWRSHAKPAATLTLPFGEFPAEYVAAVNQLDALVHGWDIGVSIGLAVTLPDELSEVAMHMALLRVPNGRGGVFGPEVTTTSTAPGARLLAFSGRDAARWPADEGELR